MRIFNQIKDIEPDGEDVHCTLCFEDKHGTEIKAYMSGYECEYISIGEYEFDRDSANIPSIYVLKFGQPYSVKQLFDIAETDYDAVLPEIMADILADAEEEEYLRNPAHLN